MTQISPVQDRAKIIVGSKAEFTIFLVDDLGRPVSLSPYASANLVFLNCKNVRTVVALTVPGANPDKGEIPVVVSSTATADADKKWNNADLELIEAGPVTTVVPLANKFEIVERFAPPPP